MFALFWAINAEYMKECRSVSIIAYHKNRMMFNQQKCIFSFIVFLSAMALFIMAAIRYDVGTDNLGYMIRFNQISNLKLANYKDSKFEFGYFLFSKVLMSITDSPQFVIAMTSAIFLLFIYLFIINFSDNIIFSVFLLITTGAFSYSLNIMRQMIAVSMFFYALKFVKEKKLLKYCIIIFIASLFHTVALIYLPVYFLLNIRLKKKMLAIIIFICFISEKLRIIFTNSVREYFPEYYGYFGSSYDSEKFLGALIVINILILIVAIILDDFYLLDYEDNVYKQSCIFYNVQVLATITAILSPIIPNSDRFVMMFMPVQIVYVPYLISRMKSKKTLTNIVFVIIYLSFFAYYILIQNYAGTLPYKTIFS